MKSSAIQLALGCVISHAALSDLVGGLTQPRQAGRIQEQTPFLPPPFNPNMLPSFIHVSDLLRA